MSAGCSRTSDRCDFDRDAKPLARADGDLGVPGWQGRVRRKTLLAQPVGGASTGSRGRRNTSRIVQHGTQSRSARAFSEAIGQMHGGTFGEISIWRVVCVSSDATRSAATPSEPVPAGVDYDLWTGPAPMKPFTKNRFHYNWHWIWDTGNGDLGNKAIHQIDAARLGPRCASADPRVGASVATSCSTTTRKRRTRSPAPSNSIDPAASEDDGDGSPPLDLEQRGRHPRRGCSAVTTRLAASSTDRKATCRRE